MANAATSDIAQFFKNLWAWISPGVKTAEQVAEAFFMAAIKDVASILGADGLQIVSDAVTAAESTGGTSGQKFAAAVSKATTDLVAIGIQAAPSVLNVAIEAAVSQMNAQAPVVSDQVAPASTAASEPATPSVTLSGAALESAVAAVQAGTDLGIEAANLVANLKGQGITIALDDAKTQLQAAVSAASGR